ncbi:hypothetical protein NM688_g6513 [Phlebia brevispora]|uniref:Uncharacterized protein n=1 Tax=Phlebia brevispora TaxID=194682 RepID=A0ACC1SFD3_9APHY|nr:hypothetical protein NM688_g6513 [Phlebia brevispora]
MTGKDFVAFVSWPSAPLTNRLVRNSLQSLESPPTIVDTIPNQQDRPLLQWSTYDSIDHELTLEQSSTILSSSYTIRKALIRKHYLARSIQNYLVKHPESILKRAIPQTWDVELTFADELEDMWGDELWDLGEALDEGHKWFILKPGMADRGMGIRLFHSKDELVKIFEEFEDSDSDEEEEQTEEGYSLDTAVVTSQLRHFVLQEYLSDPLLLDPSEVPLDVEKEQTARPTREELQGHKFHLRAYCVASGALRVFLYTKILSLFSALPYSSPSDSDDSSGMDLSAHLTNTSLQVERGEAGVRLFDELVGCNILHGSLENGILTAADLEDIKSQMADVLGETFKAAMNMSIHFQPIPNAFELFGIDFLVTHIPSEPGVSPSRKFQVSLLEVNSEPAIELTGPRLTWILEDLFKSIGKVCVAPFFEKIGTKEHTADGWEVGQTREYLQKCLDIDVRGAGGW